MDNKKYNKTNFHKHTFCIFKEVGILEINGLKPNYTSKSGSSYYFTEKGVYRVSNHWGRAANCKWRLQADESTSKERTKIGYADWSGFHPDNDTQKLYGIEVDFVANTVNYNHKNNLHPDSLSMLRTASETTKRIKLIRQILTTDDWSKYIEFDDLNNLKKAIIGQLIITDKPLQAIKKTPFL